VVFSPPGRPQVRERIFFSPFFFLLLPVVLCYLPVSFPPVCPPPFLLTLQTVRPPHARLFFLYSENRPSFMASDGRFSPWFFIHRMSAHFQKHLFFLTRAPVCLTTRRFRPEFAIRFRPPFPLEGAPFSSPGRPSPLVSGLPRGLRRNPPEICYLRPWNLPPPPLLKGSEIRSFSFPPLLLSPFCRVSFQTLSRENDPFFPLFG